MISTKILSQHQVTINGFDNKPISIDTIRLNTTKFNCCKVIIFSHGFKGFKDWGPFNEIAKFLPNLDILLLNLIFLITEPL